MHKLARLESTRALPSRLASLARSIVFFSGIVYRFRASGPPWSCYGGLPMIKTAGNLALPEKWNTTFQRFAFQNQKYSPLLAHFESAVAPPAGTCIIFFLLPLGLGDNYTPV